MITTRNILTKSNLLDVISTYQIFRAYCKNFTEISKMFKSEFREDPHPSCMIEQIGGDLLYTDFGEGSYRAIEYVMRKFNLSFRDALRKINFDFGVNLIDDKDKTYNYTPTKINKINHTPIFKEKSTTIIDVSYAPLKDYDLEYWNQYGWTEKMLVEASIKPIDYFWLTMKHKNIDKMLYAVPHELAYSYDYYRNENIFRRKLYFPEREGKGKWISNVDNTVIQNWDLLPKGGGELLFITSSKKDCGIFWRLNGHYCNAIAPNNEGSFILPEIFYKKLKPRWNRIVIWFDNDYEKDHNSGIINAKKFSSMYDIEYLYNPYIYRAKDPAELVAKYGLREFNGLLKYKLENGN